MDTAVRGDRDTSQDVLAGLAPLSGLSIFGFALDHIKGLALETRGKPDEAVDAIETALGSDTSGHGHEPIEVHIGLHTGRPAQDDGNFYGTDVNLAARIADHVAQAGQIVVSKRLHEALRRSRSLCFGEGHEVELKGLSGKHRGVRGGVDVTVCDVIVLQKGSSSHGRREVSSFDDSAAHMEGPRAIRASSRTACILPGMNLFHRWYCRSAGWKRRLHGRLLPWAVANEDLGERVLEIGPGPGIVTDWLSTQAPSVTSVEIDHKLASALTARVDKSIVTVVEADATSMPLPDEHFDSALCLTMLHHVPTVHLQDRLLSEAHRVLKPGALLMGSDSTPSPRWRFYHLFDTCMPVDPTTFALRLTAAGFTDVEVETGANSLRFRARKPYRA